MFNRFGSAFVRLLSVSAAGIVAVVLAASPGWAQSEKKEPSASEAKKDAKDTKDTAKDSAKDAAKDTTKDSAKSTKDSAKNSAKDTAKGAPDRTKDSAKSARDDVKDSAKSPRNSVRDTRDRDPRDRAPRDSAKDSRDSARDPRESRDAPELRDPRDARDRRNARDARDLRDPRDVREPARDRDARTEDRSRQGKRSVSRAQIENFRAESVTSRDLGLTFGRATDRGLVIQDISRNAVLANIGLRPRDVIVSVADRRVTSEREFVRWFFAEDSRAERIIIIVLRDGREVPIYVRPVTIIEELIVVQDDFDPLRHFGIVIDDRRPREIIVVRVLPGSPAFRAGIREGDVITTFRGQRLLGPQQFVQVLSRVEPGEVALEVNRNRQMRELKMVVPRMERRTVARPDFDVDRPAIERREERRENRTDRRDVRPDDVQPARPGVQPAQPAQPARPGILPRNR